MARIKQPVAELWQTTRNWLLLLGNKVNTKFCREEITTHPDYPAITSIIDFLESGRMQYQAVQADASYIHEFNYPLLAHIRQPGHEYIHIISNATEWDKQKEITKYWSGIVIFPEQNSHWENEQNFVYQKVSLKNKIFTIVLIAIGVALLVLSGIEQTNSSSIIFGISSLLGLIISIVLLGTELGYQNQVVKQVCGAVSNGGCEKVLKSKYAKGVLGVSPGDISVLYFGTQFIFYLLSAYFQNFLFCIVLFAFAGIIVAAWSIYTQAVKLKQWCALCLGIVAVLVLQIISAFYFIFVNSNLQIRPSFLTFIPFVIFIVSLFFLYFILSPIKKLIKTDDSNRQKLAELKKWKTDAGLFINLWKQEQQVDTAIWENDLLLGNPDAAILIIVACNPYCGPCAKAHKELDQLLRHSANKIKVLIRFLCNPYNETDNRTIAVKAILQKASQANSTTDLQQLLTDWFELMDFEKWSMKWPSIPDVDIMSRLHQHKEWVTQSSIQFTPTFFIEGRKLPGRYNLKDIEVLVPQLSELLTSEPLK